MGRLIEAGYPDWTKLKQMRVGFPAFNGPNIWYSWHVMAQRFVHMARGLERSGSPREAQAWRQKVVSSFGQMLPLFALAGQPCPACREHFLTQLSRNDQEWKSAMGSGSSQARIYPLEYLFLGQPHGEDWLAPTAGNLASKLRYINPGRPETMALFVWKLHNAVDSSVVYSYQCKTDEDAAYGASEAVLPNGDRLPGLFQCQDNGCPRMARAWPFLQRYEYWLDGGPVAWAKLRIDGGLRRATQGVDALDNDKTRRGFWEHGHGREAAVKDGTVGRVLQAIEKLDEAMIRSKVLEREYGLAAGAESFRSYGLLAEVASLGVVALPPAVVDVQPSQCKYYNTDWQSMALPTCGITTAPAPPPVQPALPPEFRWVRDTTGSSVPGDAFSPRGRLLLKEVCRPS